MNSAERKRKSREGRGEDKKSQDREVDAKAHKERRARQGDEKKTQDREVNAKAHQDKRGTNYADHRLHIETSLRRHQRLPPTSEQLLMHEQRALTSLLMYYHRCGCDNIAPAEEFAELE